MRRQDRAGQKKQLQERITQLQQEITGLTAQQDAKDKEVTLIEQELKGVRDLYAKNLVQLNRLTSLERDEAQLQGSRGQLVAQAAEAKGKIAETQLQIIQVDEDLSSDVAKELRETDSKIGEYVERKVTAEDQLKRTDIRAPQDGIVFQLTANTVGGVITAGDPIMMIVPEDDKLQVEVKVDPKDIDDVQFDQPVVLRFTSFNVRTTPGDQRQGDADRRRYHHRSAHRPDLLSGPHRDDQRRDQAARRRQADAGHAGRSLHRDRRAHDAVLSDQAVARSADAVVPRKISVRSSSRGGAE